MRPTIAQFLIGFGFTIATATSLAAPERQLLPLDEVIPADVRTRLDENREARRRQVQSFDVDSLRSRIVDLRYRDTPVKEQHAPTCTAFGAAAAIENLLGGSTELSEQHIWSKYRRYSVYSAVNAITQTGAVEEEWWPQDTSNPRRGYLDQTWYRLANVTALEDDTTEALKALEAGYPVYIGMGVPKDMADGLAVIRPETKMTKGGHAVIIVGYRLDDSVPGGGYFLIKNSWGTDNGENGYQWMPIGLCQRSGMYCVMWAFKAVSPEKAPQDQNQ